MQPILKVQSLYGKKVCRSSPRQPSTALTRKIPPSPTPTAPVPVKDPPSSLLSDTASRLSLDWAMKNKPGLEYAPEADFTAGQTRMRNNPRYEGKIPPSWLGKNI